MKRIITAILALTLLLSLSITGGLAQAEVAAATSVQQMITTALQDEINTQATYNKILETYTDAMPFKALVRAEGMHIMILNRLAGAYNVPTDLSAVAAEVPATIEETLALGIKAEQDNIAIYEKFLAEESLPQDVRFAFQRLMMASQNHLRALQNNANGTLPAAGAVQGVRGQDRNMGKGFGMNGNRKQMQRNQDGCGQCRCPRQDDKAPQNQQQRYHHNRNHR